eukprot:TRINITY_DN74423_c0_g1_i1.p1 TRINITY_DN74423_c0_g1~~TRINITY_DN74423_c0_g1_i1.p1  ORF type:complete len:473 (-),score=105.73 TRINITY_DN74423_c0_g1_i1:26-1444(-)
MLLFFTSLACFAFGGLQAVRMQTFVGSGLELEPFSVILTISNKREIMDKMATSWFGWAADYVVSDEAFTSKVTSKLETMLPPAMQEMGIQCTFNATKIEGLTGTMVMHITDYSIGEAMRKAKGEVFAGSLDTIFETLRNLGMEEKVASIDKKIGVQLRAGLMTKIPEILEQKLSEQNVKVTVRTDPPPPPADPLPEEAPSPDYSLFFHVAVRDREILAKQMDKTLLRFALRNLPQAKFLDLIQEKLKEKVSEGVQKKMGKSLDLTVSTQPDADAGANNRESFWLLLKVNSIDIAGLLSNTKGPDFAGNFSKLLDTLGTLQAEGLKGMAVTINNIHTMIDNQALGGLAASLPTMLQQSLGADVTNVSMAVFEQLQDLATSGRCCSDGGDVYWVGKKFARGSGPLGFGYGKEGRCPKITQKVVDGDVIWCAAQGSAVHKAVQTKYRPYTDCFSFSSDADATAPTQAAVVVDSYC